ncbi:hypothetical protein [Streptomyces sp. AK08-02]|uniref:hypothetical protein n=1 Tax=Streptomyces sp. AK08-02 TaxID=3028654 RepID=UPI0029A71D1F|nr:hypothetical protein [Streptomyces sp. AK08-02]MDX3747374.1 hypothetical protein [Streptomyces sp. AK08-02]
MDIAISTSLIAAGSAIGGVLIKMTYDGTVERVRTNKENRQRFIEERKVAYDDFLRLNKEHLQYRAALRRVTLIARAGLQVRPEHLQNFPPSRISDLTDALDRIRRIAHTNDVVEIVKRVISLHGDAAAALRYYLQNDTLNYGLPLFLADRLGEDQILEFISAYRRDLLIGPPVGAPANFPIVDRGFPMSQAQVEQVLRRHLQSSPAARNADPVATNASARPLTDGDRRDLQTSEFRAIIAETNT